MTSTEMRERVSEWLTSPDTSYLIGAGCSRCAGKPLIGQLTDNVIAGAEPPVKAEFAGLKKVAGRDPTIEDLINYLVRYSSILATVADASLHKLDPLWIDASLKQIKAGIVGAIVDDWVPSPVHQRFFERIRPSKRPLDVFSLNYDTIIEATLDKLRASYVDGFRGTNRAWFDASTFDSVDPTDIRLYKLHGSINWLREPTGHIRRAIVRSVADLNDDPVVIYPSEQKYLQTQYGIYESMLGRFRSRLREGGVNARLVTAGYSFNDEHINEAIIDAVSSPKSNLTVIAFIGPEADVTAQLARLQDIASRCDQRFNAYIGNIHSVGKALTDVESAELLAAELWKFENMVDFIAGPAT